MDALRRMILSLGEIRFGPPDEATRSAVLGLANRAHLWRLIEHLLTVFSWEELLRIPGRDDPPRWDGKPPPSW